MEENKKEPTPGSTPKPIVLNYVWIDGFRGLNNLGFNLGGEYRYKMEQDGAGNYELTQTENEKYVEEFFFDGENENNISLISAIVGNNAAGKTSFMRALRMILMDKNTEYYVGGGDDPKFRKERFQYLIVYVENGARKCFRSFNLEKQVKNLKDIFPNSDHPDKKGFNQTPNQLINKLYSVFYSSMMDGSIYPIGTQPGTTTDDNHLDVSSDWLCYMDSSQYYELSKSETQKNMMEFHKWEDTRREIAFIGDNEKFRTEIETFFPLPKRLTVYSHSTRVFAASKDSNDDLLSKLQTRFNGSENWNDKSEALANLSALLRDVNEVFNPSRLYVSSLFDKAEDKEKKAKCFLLEHLFLKMVSALDNYDTGANLEAYEKIENECSMYVTDFKTKEENLYTFNDTFNYLEKLIVDEIPSIFAAIFEKEGKTKEYVEERDGALVRNLWDSLMKALKDGEHIDTENFSNTSFDVELKKFENLESNHFKFTVFLTHVNRKLRDREKELPFENTFSFLSFDWSELSIGEKLRFNLFSRFHYAKKQMKENRVDPKSSVLILIDEGELGFHLKWQIEYIDDLVKMLPLIFGEERPLQIIFTTHSPVSLSDIPRDNVVFLEKKETEESKEKGNAPEDKEYVVKVKDDPIETFGANIHAIVRNGFFLKDGAMGEFAKRRITKIFERISKGEHSKRLEKEIGLIDEPIIRRQLKKKYEENLSIEEKINLRKAEIEELQAQLNKKKHDQNK